MGCFAILGVLINIDMWKFTKLQKVTKTDTRLNEGIGIKFIAEFQNGVAIETMGTTVDSKEMMEATLRSIEARLDKRDADLAAIDPATYTLPPVEEEPVAPAPTAEEQAAQAVAQAEAELTEVFEKEKRDKEIEALAATNPVVKEKLDALQALKAA